MCVLSIHLVMAFVSVCVLCVLCVCVFVYASSDSPTGLSEVYLLNPIPRLL